ncbi:hypothetical protein [Paenibacillus herberti]|uniref:Multi-TM2 domain-containing protein n=1 Tax=Paenibacillus herberti TaxID=1619309 RepID=A0A229NZT2_9BACL|nr:hypothetical protein [Paenibacillus herberti]OXM15536.1 hypothetical protein CGZ75_02015 [Paenibacillus herberti]
MRNSLNPFLVLLLGFIPGAGHAYLQKYIRMIVYGTFVLLPLAFMFLLAVTDNLDGEAVMMVLFPMLIWVISMFDLLVTLLKRPAVPAHVFEPGPMDAQGIPTARLVPSQIAENQREKSMTILLSFIPGLGQMYLGLLQRGVALMVTFAGLGTFIIFVTILLRTPVFLVLLLLMPVLWVYAMFDAVKLVQRKHLGEPLTDRSLFEEIEGHFASGRKNKTAAAALSFLPGAGHLYLGMQKRGLQLMGIFLLSIYLMDSLRMTLFLFLLPLVWCYAFFDALQQHGRYLRGELADTPVLGGHTGYNRLLGTGLILLGGYYLSDRILVEIASNYFPQFYSAYQEIRYNLPAALTAFLLIAAGLRLFLGRPNPPIPQPLHEGTEFTRRQNEEF